MKIEKGRFAAKLEGDFVVLIIGMRINRLLQVHKWGPTASAMPRMLRELQADPTLGLLHAEGYFRGRVLMIVQYWRSYDHLHAYAHAKNKQHLPAWAAFSRRVGGNSAVGIFHESYLVRAGEYEAIYANMPYIGLARAGRAVPATGAMQSARSRLAETARHG